MVIPSESLASLSYFQFRDSRVGWHFQTLCNAQWLLLHCICWIAKATESSVQSLAFWRSPNCRLPETGTIKQRCIAILFSKSVGQVQSSMCCSSADLVKFKRFSEAAGVVLCHRAVYCRLSSSWNNIVHDWRWQIKQKALSLVHTKEAIPEAAVGECWGPPTRRSCSAPVSEVCEAFVNVLYCDKGKGSDIWGKGCLWFIASSPVSLPFLYTPES